MKEIKAYVHRNRVADVITAVKATYAWSSANPAARMRFGCVHDRGLLGASGRRGVALLTGTKGEVVNESELESLCWGPKVSELVAPMRPSGHAGGVTVTDIVSVTPLG